jgi:glutamate 5-kinase
MKIVIKGGSSLLVDKKGHIDEEWIMETVRQTAELRRSGNQVIIVSSGAVASDSHKDRSSNLRSGVGQPRLMSRYIKFFDIYGIDVSQHLLTDRDVLGEGSEITKRTLLEAFENGVVPIINGNDVVDDKELKALEVCADNDVLFKSVCLMIKADIGIICFDGEGFIGENGEILHEINVHDFDNIFPYIKDGNELGHGKEGMKVKVQVLTDLAKSGIQAILTPGRRKNSILRSLHNEKRFGTRFVL